MIHSAKKTSLVAIGLIVAILIIFFISLNTGTIPIGPSDVVKTLLGTGDGSFDVILFDFRLPRMVIALLIGIGMGIAGAILQGVSQNGLADPGILGINAGAGFAVVLYIFFLQDKLAGTGSLQVFIMPLFAFAGAFLAASLIYALAWKKGVTPVRLILVGIGVNAAFGGLIIVFQLMMEPKDFTQATIWLNGSIWQTSWNYVLALLPWIILLVPYAIFKAKALNVLTLGDQIAVGVGAPVQKERTIMLLLAVALAGACVAAGGAITFLGLVAPHLARRIVGPNHKHLLPICALIGALIMLVADTLSRTILAPSEIPIGLVVSAIGAPYFIYLLIKE
nr:iron ABC transporter permease [Terribacillus saccharophilus]